MSTELFGTSLTAIKLPPNAQRFSWSQLSGAPGFNFSPVSFLMEAGPLYSRADASSCRHDQNGGGKNVRSGAP